MKDLINLYTAPAKFFRSLDTIQKWSYLIPVVMFYGMALTMERIDKVYFRAVMRESGQTTLPDQGWLYWGQYVGESWFYYWAMVFIFGGIVGGVIVWWVGGWWYKLRLKW